MSIVLKLKEFFYDILFKYFVGLTEMIPNIFELVLAGFVLAMSYVFYRVHERRCRVVTFKSKSNLMELEKVRDYNRSLIRHRSIISHKDMLKTLEYAADRCSDKYYALKCIDIIVHCPYLVNVKCLLNSVTPFHRICFHGYTCLITFALAKGADPCITTIAGENALCMAVYHCLNNPAKNDFSSLEVLHRTGCKFGFKDRWYNSLLKMAFTNNHMKLVQWLVLHHQNQSYNIMRCSSTPPIQNNYELN